jgi:UrcA family protein
MTTAITQATPFRRSLALAGACAALLVTTLSVAAPSSDEVPSVRVRYDDLNLGTTAGVAVLYRRISFAAREVCPGSDSRDLNLLYRSERCRAQAIARAVTQVNNPQLASLHAAHMSRG